MPQSYTLEFKRKIVHLHLEEGRTLKRLAEEYTTYPKQVFQNESASSVKNARQTKKPKPIMII